MRIFTKVQPEPEIGRVIEATVGVFILKREKVDARVLRQELDKALRELRSQILQAASIV